MSSSPMRPQPVSPVSPDALALQRLYHWERSAPDRVVLTQPLGGGVLRNYTWAQVCLLYTSPSPRDGLLSRMPSSA